MATRGLNQAELVKELRKQVTALEDDLRLRSDEVEEFATALRSEYDEAREAQRTAATYGAWRDERVTQVAAAWVLGTVFVRFCEDNRLIEWPFLTGPGERSTDAEERHVAFFRANPQLNDRDWIVAAFDHLASTHPTVAELFDKRYNPLWEITPSFEAATALIGFWRRHDDDGEIRFDFTDHEWDTRFLGDLYQDLSEHARKTYALLQTPQFVEEFILDLTLEPAVEEFGLVGLRTIDPACGSGHFLLGIFDRLLAKWRSAEPGADDWELIRRSMESVHGCDKNPFAASIARFRLLIAALRATGQSRLDKAAIFPINIAVGDSLLHGRGALGTQTASEIRNGELREPKPHTYRTEDIDEFTRRCDLLGRSSYHVVAGNPPYITVKDKKENENYRQAYQNTCSGKYALSAPFAARLFQLAIRTHGSERDAGYVGQITANSFMKREFGKKLIEEFFPTVNLTHVIDTSGAYIPGHGTPTVILIGRNHIGRSAENIRAVLGVRGEPIQPKNPSSGLVWQAIVTQLSIPQSASEWITVEDVERNTFSKHPWSVSGGGAGELFAALESGKPTRLRDRLVRIGFYGVMGTDEVMTAPIHILSRQTTEAEFFQPLTVGDEVRDWTTRPGGLAFHPYDKSRNLVSLEVMPQHAKRMWPFRTELGNRATFTKGTYFSDGRPWHEWHQLPKDKEAHDWSIAFAEVTTHNHYVLERKGKVFQRTAPMLKMTREASEDDHLSLLGLLNSSTVCFWLKQSCFDKGNGGIGGGISDELWEHRFAFNASKVEQIPLPKRFPLDISRELDVIATKTAKDLQVFTEGQAPTSESLAATRTIQQEAQSRMIALQEELDWKVYGSYDLLNDTEISQLTASNFDTVPGIKLGERAFEIVLARKVAAGKDKTAWFARHSSLPVLDIPSHWPDWYREIVQTRINVIEERQDIALIERPECKRRWATVPWEKREAEALRAWLLDRCENPALWFALRDGVKHPRALTVNQLADKFRDDAHMQLVAQLYATGHLGKRDLTLAQVLEQVIADQHVPYLTTLRYKDSGLRKRAEWEQVWELQREEDRTEQRLNISVPPKYGSGDFLKISYWSQRGKLDVPKERFISYPDANPDADPTLLLGWAGWDHKDQSQAIVNIVNDRVEQSGWDRDKITPLLAGLQELMPWVNQWHGEYDDEWGGIPAEEYSAYLTSQRTTHQLTEDDLREWRPAAPTRGRRAAKKG